VPGSGSADQSITVVIPEISDVSAYFDVAPTIAPGVPANADLIVTVSGNTAATHLTVRVAVPPTLVATAPDATIDPSGALTWSIASIAPQTPVRLPISVVPANAVPVGAAIELHATVERPNGPSVDASTAIEAVSAASMHATPSSSPATSASPWVVLGIATTLLMAMIVGPGRASRRRTPVEPRVSP
jgi:hypothetical protein